MKKLNTNHQVVRRLLERYPRGGTWMRMFLMLMIMMMSSAFAMAQETYGIKVAGEDITGYNRYDLTEISGVSGTVYFDPSTRTLTLDNATIEANDYNAILNETCDYLTIELIGTNTIDVTGAAGIKLKEETTIWSNSGGKLSVKSDGCALLFGGCPLEISNCWLEAEGAWGISANNNVAEEVLTIRNSHVEATGSTGSICDIAGLELDGCFITQPTGAKFDANVHAVTLKGDVVTYKVVIAPNSYGIKVAGKEVTSLNCKDLSVIDGVDGKMSYNPETNTLTMEKVTINSAANDGIVNYDVKGLKIEVVGNNTITANQACVSILEESTISGSGNLRLKSWDNCGLFMTSSLTIEGIRLYAEGKWGIAGQEAQTSGNVLTICDAYVEATGSMGSMCDLQDLLLDVCSIMQPKGAAFDTDKHAVVLNGLVVKSKVVIKSNSYGFKIAGEYVTTDNYLDLTEISGVSGKVYFDPKTRILTLDNATIETNGNNAILNEDCINLAIKLIGTNTINVTGAAGITLKEETAILSNSGGKLSIKSDLCALLFGGCPIEISNCRLEAEGAWGISARNNVAEEVLTIRNSHVEATGSTGSICDIAKLVLDGCSIIQPKGAKFDAKNNAVVLNGEMVTDKVVIEPDNYGIKIAGEYVTYLNCKDLSVIDGVDGKMSYNPETNTLTMEDVTFNATDHPGIETGYVKGFKIEVVGNNTITTNKACILTVEESTISGSGTLRLKSRNGSGLYVRSSLTVEGVSLYAEGAYGVAGLNGERGEILTLRNAYVEATGSRGSMSKLQNLILDNCAITQPDGAEFDANQKAVVLNGEMVKSKVVITPVTSGISDTTVDASARKKGIYSLTGVKQTLQWNELPAGIYIVDGVKRVKK